MKNEFPSNRIFLEKIKRIENDCEKFSKEKLNSLSENTIKTYSNLGAIMSLLYRFSCCYWGCKTKDHKLEYIAGRVVNHSLASIRLLEFGYYDESLSLTRNISEIANLLTLFTYDHSSFELWKSLGEFTAWKEFSPSKVRFKIKSLNGFVPISKEEYGRLCNIGTHINPLTSPQKYNPNKISCVGAFYQEAGFMIALNELASSIGIAAGSASYLSNLDLKIKKKLLDQSINLIKLIEEPGSINTVHLKNIWENSEK